MEDYHSQHNILERRVKRLEKDVKSLKTKLEDLDEYVNRKTLIDLIQEIVLLLIGKKGKTLFEFFEDSDSNEIIERFYRREKKNVSHK